MFFYLSKILGFFLSPSNLLACLLIAGLVGLKTRFARAGRRILVFAVVALVAGAFLPVGNVLLSPLENRFKRPHLTKSSTPPYGIIVLGGSVDTVISRARGEVALNESAERLFTALALAKRFPETRILFSGGSGRLLYRTMSEAEAVKPFFADMGIAPHRLILEGRSRNTWQNARYVKKMLASRSTENWLLVTSAFHMPRAVGTFRKAGINVTPWPTDFRTRGNGTSYRVLSTAASNWKRMDLAVREWFGLLVYRLTGRTKTLFPHPAIAEK